jgi:hypothetical protein
MGPAAAHKASETHFKLNSGTISQSFFSQNSQKMLCIYCAGIFKQSVGARNRVGIGCRTGPPGYIVWEIDSLESILGLLKSL